VRSQEQVGQKGLGLERGLGTIWVKSSREQVGLSQEQVGGNIGGKMGRGHKKTSWGLEMSSP